MNIEGILWNRQKDRNYKKKSNENAKNEKTREKRDEECLWWTHKKSLHRGEKNISELEESLTKSTQTETERNKNGEKEENKHKRTSRAVGQYQTT